jgi:hypothetical protein
MELLEKLGGKFAFVDDTYYVELEGDAILLRNESGWIVDEWFVGHYDRNDQESLFRKLIKLLSKWEGREGSLLASRDVLHLFMEREMEKLSYRYL